MKFVGIDPSTKTGFVALNEQGEVLIEKELSTKETKDPQRFLAIATEVSKLIDSNDRVFIEGFSYGSQGRGLSVTYGIGWIIRLKIIMRGISYFDVPPSVLKKFATGKGNSPKNVVIKESFKKFQYEHPSDNVVDAYVLAELSRQDHLGFKYAKDKPLSKKVERNDQ